MFCSAAVLQKKTVRDGTVPCTFLRNDTLDLHHNQISTLLHAASTSNSFNTTPLTILPSQWLQRIILLLMPQHLATENTIPAPRTTVSLFKMDPFKKLPAELRVEILVKIRCRRTTSQPLIQASPIMREQYLTSKEHITRTLLALDLDAEMVQDAMAVILCSPQYSSGRYATLLDCGRCRYCEAQQLPNPLQEPSTDRSRTLIEELDKLHERLLFFIEDYLTKATAVSPPREYRCLSEFYCLSEFSQRKSRLTFKGQPISPRFDAENLTGPERKRLLRAFLRYELGALTWPRSHILECREEKMHKCINTVSELRQWREPSPGDDDDDAFYRMHTYPDPLDREAIRCVHTYLESLYGAMFAQCADSELPSSSRRLGAELLDAFYACPDEYLHTMRCEGHLPCASHLASYGFGLLMPLLRLATSGRQGRARLKRWFGDANFSYVIGDMTGSYPHRSDSFHEADDEARKSGPAIYRMLYPRISNTFRSHRKLYQQRAWVFFDDDRFYPSGEKPHFPTSDDLRQEQIDRKNAFMDVYWLWRQAPRTTTLDSLWDCIQRRTSSEDTGTESVPNSDSDSDSETECQVVLLEADGEQSGIPEPFWH